MIQKKKKKSKGDYYFTVACSKKYKCRVKKNVGALNTHEEPQSKEWRYTWNAIVNNYEDTQGVPL